jgi:hypothetical protein
MPPVNFNMAQLKVADIQTFDMLLNRATLLHVAWLKSCGFSKKEIGMILQNKLLDTCKKLNCTYNG